MWGEEDERGRVWGEEDERRPGGCGVKRMRGGLEGVG